MIHKQKRPKPVVYYPQEPTPEIVEAHLRADRNLTPETAAALSELFRVAYTQFSRKCRKACEETTLTSTRRLSSIISSQCYLAIYLLVKNGATLS